MNIKFYNILSLACVTGCLWLFVSNYFKTNIHSICFFKNITNFPCPSCGSTRAVFLLLKGRIFESIYLNPIGVLLFIGLVITPFWIFYDLYKQKQSLLDFYFKLELYLNNKFIAFPTILLIILNWIWNIQKGL